MIKKSMLLLCVLVSFTLVEQGFSISKKEVEQTQYLNALYNEGVRALVNEDYDSAKTFFHKIISLGEATCSKETVCSSGVYYHITRSIYYLGDIAFLEKRYQEAIDIYRSFLNNYDTYDLYEKALYKLGRTLILYGQSTQKVYIYQGISILYDYITKYSNTHQLVDNSYYWIGRGYVLLGEYERARNIFQLLMDAYPDTAFRYEVESLLQIIEKFDSVKEDPNARKIYKEGLYEETKNVQEQEEDLKKLKEILDKKNELLQEKQKKLLKTADADIEEV